MQFKGRCGRWPVLGSLLCWIVWASVGSPCVWAQLHRVKQNHLWGLIDEKGKTVLPPEYDEIGGANGEDSLHIRVIRKGKHGVIAANGQTLIPPQYDLIGSLRKPYILVNKGGNCHWGGCEGGLWGAINLKNETLIPIQFDELAEGKYGFVRVRKQDRWGLFTQKGEPALPPLYLELIIFQPEFIFAQADDGWKLFDARGRFVANGAYDTIQVAANGNILVEKENRWNMIIPGQRQPLNLSYDKIVETVDIFQFDSTSYFFVQNKGKWGLMNGAGRLLAEPRFYKLTRAGRRHFYAYNERDELIGVLDAEGYWLEAARFEALTVDVNDRIQFKRNGKWGVVSANGKIMIEAQYDRLVSSLAMNQMDFLETRDLYLTENDSLLGCVKIENEQEKPILPARFQGLKVFTENLYATQTNGQWAIFGKNGKPILEAQYDDYRVFDQRFILAYQERYFTLTTLTGQTLSENKFMSIDTLGGGYYRLIEDVNARPQRGCVIDSMGRVASRRLFTRFFSATDENVFIVEQNKRWGVIDSTDKILVSIEFDEIVETRAGLAVVRLDEKLGLHSLKNDFSLKPQFDEIEIINEKLARGLLLGEWQDIQTAEDATAANETENAPNTEGLPPQPATDPYLWTRSADAAGQTIYLLVPRKDVRGQHESVVYHKIRSARAMHKTPLAQPIYAVHILNHVGLTLYSVQPLARNRFWGVINHRTGEATEGCLYEKIYFQDFDSAEVARVRYPDGSFGLLRLDGSVVRTASFKMIGAFHNGLATVKIGLKWGYLNRKGNIAVNAAFDKVADFSHNRAVVGSYFQIKNKKTGRLTPVLQYGVIDPTGKIVVEQKYARIENLGAVFAYYQKAERYGVIDAKGRFLASFQADRMTGFQKDGAARFYIGEKAGLVRADGKILAAPRYEAVYAHADNMTRVLYGGKMGYCDTTGKLTIEAKYAYATDFAEGYAIARRDTHWFVINHRGDETRITAAQLFDAEPFSGGMACCRMRVGRRTGYGFLYPSGQVAIEPQFARSAAFEQGYAVMKDRAGKLGLIDRQGNWTIEPVYARLERLNRRLYLAQDKNLWGLLNAQNKTIQPLKYERIKLIEHNFILLKRNGKYGLARPNGSIVIDVKYDYLGDIAEGCLRYGLGGYEGFIDTNGVALGKKEFIKVKDFSDGMARVMARKKIQNAYVYTTGYIDKQNNLLRIPRPVFHLYKDFKEGLALGKDGFIDKQGRLVAPRTQAASFHNGTAWFKETAANGLYKTAARSKYGLVNRWGEDVIRPRYQKYKDINGYAAAVQCQDLWGVVRASGSEAVTPKFEKLTVISPQTLLYFSTQQIGLLDADGLPLLDPVYDWIDREGALIRVEKEGKIGYLTPNGQWLWNLSE